MPRIEQEVPLQQQGQPQPAAGPPLPQNIINAHKERRAVERQMPSPTGGPTTEPAASIPQLSQLSPGWFKRQYEQGPGQLVEDVRVYLKQNSLKALDALKRTGEENR